MINVLPNWNNSSKISLGIFYSNIQDINIYVEDENSEIFYKEFFDNILDKTITIRKIISLKGRDNVIDGAKNYKQSKPALFIIDADLNLLLGERVKLNRLFEHDKYCIENYLFSKEGLVELIYETLANQTKEDIKSNIEWEKTLINIENTLLNLFVEFAIIRKIDKSIKTVKLGVKDLFESNNQNEPIISYEKTNLLINEKINELILKNINNYNFISKQYNTYKSIIKNNLNRENKTDFISGKHYLIQILFRLLKKHTNSQITTESFKLRLSKHFNTSEFNELKSALEQTARGNIYIEK